MGGEIRNSVYEPPAILSNPFQIRCIVVASLAEPLELPDDGRRYIDEETDWNYDPFGGAEKNQKPCVTVEEFMNQYLNR